MVGHLHFFFFFLHIYGKPNTNSRPKERHDTFFHYDKSVSMPDYEAGTHIFPLFIKQTMRAREAGKGISIGHFLRVSDAYYHLWRIFRISFWQFSNKYTISRSINSWVKNVCSLPFASLALVACHVNSFVFCFNRSINLFFILHLSVDHLSHLIMAPHAS